MPIIATKLKNKKQIDHLGCLTSVIEPRRSISNSGYYTFFINNSMIKVQDTPHGLSLDDNFEHQVNAIVSSTSTNYNDMMNFRAYGFGNSIISDCKLNNKWDIEKISNRIESDFLAKTKLINKIQTENNRNYNPYSSQVPLSQEKINMYINILKEGKESELNFLNLLKKDNNNK